MLQALLLLGGGLLILSGTGCGEEESAPQATERMIEPDGEIRKIREGFSVVSYGGDYGFDSFLKQGGADSDRAVLAFLTGNLLASAKGLSFEGAPFGCSTISSPGPEGSRLFGRNFDWQKCDIMVVASDPPTGYRSLSTVNMDFIRQATRGALPLLPDRVLTIAALYAPLDGMNEKGLCVAVNMIEDRESIDQRSAKPDITTTTAIRLLLDRAADTEEAVALLASYDFHASFGYMVHFALSDRTGRTVAVEYVDNIMRVVESPVLTNFYLADGEKKGIGSSQSHARYDILSEIGRKGDLMTRDDMRDALSRVSKRNFEEFLSTEWSIVFDQTHLTGTYYHRENFNRGYTFTIP